MSSSCPPHDRLLHHTTPHHTISHHPYEPHHTAPHHTTPHHNKPHHITTNHTMCLYAHGNRSPHLSLQPAYSQHFLSLNNYIVLHHFPPHSHNTHTNMFATSFSSNHYSFVNSANNSSKNFNTYNNSSLFIHRWCTNPTPLISLATPSHSTLPTRRKDISRDCTSYPSLMTPSLLSTHRYFLTLLSWLHFAVHCSPLTPYSSIDC